MASLHATLELLALHYGMIDMGRMEFLRADGAYGRAIKDFLEFAGVFATTAHCRQVRRASLSWEDGQALHCPYPNPA